MSKDRRAEYRITICKNLWWKYLVEYKPWWSPIWFSCLSVGDINNGFDSIKIAEAFAKRHAELRQTNDLNTIKKLGRLP